MIEPLHRAAQYCREGAASGAGILSSLLVLCFLLSGNSAAGTPADRVPGIANASVRFEQVQSGDTPLFLARGLDYQCFLAPGYASIAVRKAKLQEHEVADTQPHRGSRLTPPQLTLRSLNMRFAGANPSARISGLTAVPGTMNYLLGNNPAQWRTGIPSFGTVTVEGLYPGIDLVYYGNQRRLEYDFVCAPGADPGGIVIEFTGADGVSINPQGELVVTVGADRIVQPRPVLYQWNDGLRQHVSGGYRRTGPCRIGFHTGDYDRAKALVIDPILSYSSLFGGNLGDLALSVKVDAEGSIYVAGETLSTEFPMSLSGFDTTFGGGRFNGDAFVAKFNAAGSALVYFTYLGGSGNDGALDLAVDAAGHAHICGFTDSPDFPTRNALFPSIKGKPTPNNDIYHQDAFIAELDAVGQNLVYSTYYGGTNTDRADAIALDGSGATLITGLTYSRDFPLLNPLPGQRILQGPYDAFVAKFGPGGAPLVYSTFLGGTNADEGQGIAADASGFAYVTGFTSSTNFPVTPGAYRSDLNGYQRLTPLFDAFVSKIVPMGGALAYSTLLGGTNSDAGFRIAVDSRGNALVTGSTLSLDFPNTATNLGFSAGFTNPAAANSDSFITRLSPEGDLDWSVRHGGFFNDVGWDIALDPAGNPYVTGTTSSTNFPTFNDTGFPALQKARLGYESVFVTAVTQDGSAPLYSVVIAGSGNDRGYGIAVDPAGNAYVVGKVTSTNFPLASALQGSRLGTNDTFLAKIALEPTLQTDIAGGALELRWRAFAPEFALEYSTNPAPASAWTPVAQVPVLSNGWHTVRPSGTNSGGFFRLRVP